ncbi:hypothetical protein [Nitrosomonas oligotropha]|uniref:Uncharacterized protein n=1 Tax=Nitrosomonas oligotropha TaxID=42354 RepID=A0A1H8VRH7_9PROT|nr:hypothetical protein [Nitrosomonas oligotropha]SDX65610.1 hypothetical protein SAMN05216300_1793 [Nitrosomonas oligotropha]SEP18036.1 hypothetical protein SAMN05216333_1764 [Nitrosomonas oligotropha]
MEKALKTLFNSIKQGMSDTVEADLKGTLIEPAAPLALMKSGEANFPFHLDSNGKCKYEVEEHGYGITAHCTIWFESPDAAYSIKITSTGGTEFQSPPNVRINQRLEFKLKTKLIGKTKVTVEGSANVINTDGNGKITYSF